jgi:proton-dependent oligopeptide transporter, POT family
MKTFFGHPRGLGVLFAAEMWERFSYYGMRAILVLYMVHVLKYPDAQATHVYGWYTGLVWFTPLVGGWLADRVFGTRRALLIGGSIIAAGHFVLAIPATWSFYPGLALIVLGTGLFKPNASTMVGQLYEPGDTRRDAGYTIFYMGINLGSFFAPFICGYLGQKVNWHYGFAAAGVGMVLGLISYVTLRDRYLPGIGLQPVKQQSSPGVPTHHPRLTSDEWNRIRAIWIVFLFAAAFWLSYEQAGSSLNLFADRYLNLHVGSFAIPSSWFQAVQPLYVIVFAAVFAAMWQWLGKRGMEPSTALKMALGLLLVGAGYAFMIIAGRQVDVCLATHRFAADCAIVSPVWLMATYLVGEFGELCLSPVGLSYVSKVAPRRLLAFYMGVSFLPIAAGSFIGGRLAGLESSMSSQAQFFSIFCVLSIGAGVLMLLCVPTLRRLTASVTDS